MKTFEELLEGLSKAKIDYILIGGLAVELCGFSRVTMDVDILIDISKDNIKRLLDCLKFFGKGSARELNPDDFTLEEGSIRIIEEFPLDIFTLVKGKTYQDLLLYTAIFTTEKGIKIRYLNANGIIMLKEKSLRPKDQLDVQELKRIKEGNDE